MQTERKKLNPKQWRFGPTNENPVTLVGKACGYRTWSKRPEDCSTQCTTLETDTVNLSRRIAAIISKRGSLLAASGATLVLAKAREGKVR